LRPSSSKLLLALKNHFRFLFPLVCVCGMSNQKKKTKEISKETIHFK